MFRCKQQYISTFPTNQKNRPFGLWFVKQPLSKKSFYHQGGRRETASGFYPWGNVVSTRKRVAVGLCGWRHGNSFPMTQSAQSHSQMRSIPHCPKAVFYVFVFDSIDDSATVHNLSPGIFLLNLKMG